MPVESDISLRESCRSSRYDTLGKVSSKCLSLCLTLDCRCLNYKFTIGSVHSAAVTFRRGFWWWHVGVRYSLPPVLTFVRPILVSANRFTAKRETGKRVTRLERGRGDCFAWRFQKKRTRRFPQRFRGQHAVVLFRMRFSRWTLNWSPSGMLQSCEGGGAGSIPCWEIGTLYSLAAPSLDEKHGLPKSTSRSSRHLDNLREFGFFHQVHYGPFLRVVHGFLRHAQQCITQLLAKLQSVCQVQLGKRRFVFVSHTRNCTQHVTLQLCLGVKRAAARYAPRPPPAFRG